MEKEQTENNETEITEKLIEEWFEVYSKYHTPVRTTLWEDLQDNLIFISLYIFQTISSCIKKISTYIKNRTL